MNEQALDKILAEIRETLLEKNKRYGRENIARFGERGVLVRASDKVERLIQMVWNSVADTADESVEDSWRDLAGYAIIGLMVRRGKW